MRESYSQCPNCDGGNIFVTAKDVSAGGGHAPNYLPGLGGFFAAEKFKVVVCSDCGLTRLFATRTAREKLRESEKWQRA
jgi:predicted nucleic-acid-binding Zn-ribbon protein